MMLSFLEPNEHRRLTAWMNLFAKGNKPEILLLGNSRMFQMDPEYISAIYWQASV